VGVTETIRLGVADSVEEGVAIGETVDSGRVSGTTVEVGAEGVLEIHRTIKAIVAIISISQAAAWALCILFNI